MPSSIRLSNHSHPSNPRLTFWSQRVYSVSWEYTGWKRCSPAGGVRSHPAGQLTWAKRSRHRSSASENGVPRCPLDRRSFVTGDSHTSWLHWAMTDTTIMSCKMYNTLLWHTYIAGRIIITRALAQPSIMPGHGHYFGGGGGEYRRLIPLATFK